MANDNMVSWKLSGVDMPPFDAYEFVEGIRNNWHVVTDEEFRTSESQKAHFLTLPWFEAPPPPPSVKRQIRRENKKKHKAEAASQAAPQREAQASAAALARANRLSKHEAAESTKHAIESARRREVRAAVNAAKAARAAKEAAEEEARQLARSVTSRAGASTVALEHVGESERAKKSGKKAIAIEEARVAYGVRKEMERQRLARTTVELEKKAKNLAIGDSLCWG